MLVQETGIEEVEERPRGLIVAQLSYERGAYKCFNVAALT